MKLSKDYQYIVLCEDAQMKTFITAFLVKHKIVTGKIRVRSYPCGEGCGEEFVRREYAKEIRVLKSMPFIKTVLIVCTDADNKTIENKMKLLEDSVLDTFPKWDRSKEPVVLWIPKREIETWIYALSGKMVDEDLPIRHSGKPISCKKEAGQFALYCQDQAECAIELNSMVFAKQEYKRVCQLQK